MGVGQSKNAEMLRFVEREWQFLRQENGVRVVRNCDSDAQAEIVGVLLDPRRSVEKEYEIYQYRRTQENALVSVYAVQGAKSNDTSFCGNSQMLRVAVERIGARLKDLPQLPFPAALYLLSEAIRGYSVCFRMMGEFQVTSRMIGLNNKGHVKVWLHENFAENHPVDERPQLYMATHEGRGRGNKQELLMLQEVLAVVEEKCEGGRFPQDFRTRIYGKSNFTDAYYQIEAYSKDRGIDIPASIDTARLSSSLTKSKSSLTPSLPFVASQYQPRETLIKNLAFSQSNQYYLQSPQIRKTGSHDRVPLMAPMGSPSLSGFPAPLSPRFPSSQITFNYSKAFSPQLPPRF